MFLIAYLNASHDRVTPRVVIRTPRNVTIGPVNKWTVSRIGIHGARSGQRTKRQSSNDAGCYGSSVVWPTIIPVASVRAEAPWPTAPTCFGGRGRYARTSDGGGQGNARSNHRSLDAFHSSLHRRQGRHSLRQERQPRTIIARHRKLFVARKRASAAHPPVGSEGSCFPCASPGRIPAPAAPALFGANF